MVQWFSFIPRNALDPDTSPLYHNLAFYASGTIASLIATGFLIKVYPIWSFSLA